MFSSFIIFCMTNFLIFFFIKMYYCAGPPLPACPHLHTTVGLLNIISFRFLNLKLNFDSIYYPLSGKADILKYLKFQSVRLMWLVLNQIWKKLKKTPKICKKLLFFTAFWTLFNEWNGKNFGQKWQLANKNPYVRVLGPAFWRTIFCTINS